MKHIPKFLEKVNIEEQGGARTASQIMASALSGNKVNTEDEVWKEGRDGRMGFFSFKKSVTVITAELKTPFLLHDDDIPIILLDNPAGVIMITSNLKTGEQHVIIQRYLELEYLMYLLKPPIPVFATIFRFEQKKFKPCISIIKKYYTNIVKLDKLIESGFNYQ